MVVDFRPTNLMFSNWPHPIVDRAFILRSLPRDKQIYSVLDIQDAFYQIKIQDDDLKDFFGIKVMNRFLRYKSLPQG